MKFDYGQKYFQDHFSGILYGPYLKMRNRIIADEIKKLSKSGNFLDIGFGDDNLISLFKDNFNVYGIDISDFAVKQISKQYNKNNFRLCDITNEPVPFDNKFDVIVAINTIEHLDNPEKAIQNIYNSLKSGGVLAIYLPTMGNLFSKLSYKFRYDVEEHIFRPSPKHTRQILERNNFQVVKEYSAGFFPIKTQNKALINSFNLQCIIARKK
jgi:SAM-dependent methyltransferase